MRSLRIAFATNGKKGLEDSISDVFGRAETFTVLNAEGEKITELKILENSAKTYQHGAGPIAVKMLLDEGVTVVAANELGVGASELLKQHNIEHVSIKSNTKVGEALRITVKKLEAEAHQLKPESEMEKRRKILNRNKHSREPHNKLKNTAWNATKQALKRVLEESDRIVAF